MSDINFPAQDISQSNPAVGGESIRNVKRMTIGDGSVRIEGGAIIISDETGTDRVLIGYLKDGF